jgi:hypothetical protein
MQLLTRTCHYDRMNVQRIFARGFVIFGGLIWVVAALGSPYGNRTISLLASVGNSFLLLAATVAVFVLSLFYERLTAALLFVADVLATLYGLVAGWEAGVWALMAIVLIAPMGVAGLLFLLAARMQNVCSLSEEDLGVAVVRDEGPESV